MHLLPALGFGSVGPCWAFTWRFGHAQTASSQPSRIHVGTTDSKCICSPHSGVGVWGHVGLLHGDLGTYKPLRHNTDSTCIRSPCSGLGVWDHAGPLHQTTYTAIWTRSNPIETQLVRVAGWAVLVEHIDSDSGFRFSSR